MHPAPLHLAPRSLHRFVVTAALFSSVMSHCAVGLAHRPDVGEPIGEWSAIALDGAEITRKSFDKAVATVIVFVCDDCPVSLKYTSRFHKLSESFRGDQVRFIALNPTNSRSEMRAQLGDRELPYLYAFDTNGKVARMLGAKVTPEVFVFDRDWRLRYRGAIDNSQRRPTSHYLRDALKSIVAGQKPRVEETRPFGFSIRITEGNGEQGE